MKSWKLKHLRLMYCLIIFCLIPGVNVKDSDINIVLQNRQKVLCQSDLTTFDKAIMWHTMKAEVDISPPKIFPQLSEEGWSRFFYYAFASMDDAMEVFQAW